jgi:aldehyde:ferredoxin oxidoreductase
LDTISCGNVIAFSFAAQHAGKLSKELVGSLALEFGNGETVLALIEMIANRQGLGDLLAEGVRRAGDTIGVPDLALHVKGLEIPMHDPRAFFGLATTYAVAPIGASHMQGDIHTVEMGVEIPEYEIEPGDRHSNENKGLTIARLRNWRALFNSLPFCQLALLEPPLVTELYNTVTGRTLTPLQLLEIGERSMTVKRAFNIRCGITKSDDCLPKGLQKPFSTGSNEGKVPNVELQLQQFYDASSWDPKTGKPTRELLTKLGLNDIAKDLWSNAD